MKLLKHEIIAYYTFLLCDPLTHRESGWIKTECPFHHDPFESLRIDPETGDWECQCGDGGIHAFQVRAYSANWEEADDEIKEIISQHNKDQEKRWANSFSPNANDLGALNERFTFVEP